MSISSHIESEKIGDLIATLSDDYSSFAPYTYFACPSEDGKKLDLLNQQLLASLNESLKILTEIKKIQDDCYSY